MPTLKHYFTSILIIFLKFLATPTFLVAAHIIDEKLTDSLLQPSPASHLSSNVIFQSPSVDNIYNDLIVSSKALNLRKYLNRSKTKKTKKDSRIFYIPIPPLPYRFIPGIGYDYQPMKIQPLLVDPEVSIPAEPFKYSNYKIPNPFKQYQQQFQVPYYNPLSSLKQTYKIHHSATQASIRKPQKTQSNIFRADRDNYYFNGRPFRLQVANAEPKHSNLTAQNLKSSFYFDKNIV